MFPIVVHRTAGFYSEDKATEFIKDNPDRYNFSHVVDAATGKVIKTYTPQTE